MLYRDMIDIKGPMIFALDALGYHMGGFFGIWLLEWALCWLGLLASWQAFAQLGLSLRARLGTMLAVLALYSTRYYYGNMTEDWTFHLALIAQWAFITMLLDKRFSWGPALVAALTFAIVAWMRTNNGAFWGAWYLVLFCHWCLREQWRCALALLFSSLLGLALIGGPCSPTSSTTACWPNSSITPSISSLRAATAPASRRMWAASACCVPASSCCCPPSSS